MALALALARTARRGLFAASRELVRAAEEMAGGRYDKVPVLSAGDPLAPAAEALERLGTSVQACIESLERRVRMLDEIIGGARESVYLLTNTEGDLRFASAGAEALFGWTNAELTGRNLSSIFEPEEYDAFLPKLSRRSLREGSLEHEGRLRGRDGTVFRASLRVGSFRNLPGDGEGWILEIRDVTPQENLRQALRESEAQHRTLVEGLPLGVLVLQNGKIVYGNAALKELLAIEEDPSGHDFREYLAAEDLLQVLDRIRRAESGEEPSFLIDCGLRPAGSQWPTEVRLSASRTFFGGWPAVIGSVREIGPDRDALRRVLISEAKLDAALEASEEAVLLLGAAPSGGTVTLGNRRFEELFGMSPRDLAGLSLDGLAESLAPLFARPGDLRDSLRNLASQGVDVPAVILESAHPPRRTFELSSRAARDRKGRVIGRLLAIRDITEHKEQQKRLVREAEELANVRDLLQRTNGELGDVNQELQKRTAEVERANLELRTLDEMKSNLLANVSHELQTPLVSIKGYTEMILKGRLGSVTEEQRKGLEVSLRNIDRLIGMINNLLNFSRIERDMSSMRIASWPLHQLVDEAIDVVREEASERRITLTTRYLTDDLTVKADRDKISQVFINLLANAVKYNRDGGQAEVDVRKGKKGYLIVDVRDTGVGIPKDSLERIFERFYREPAGGASSAPGSGIGLAIVRDILRMHGCIIKADSRLGEGSVFTFTLPLAATPQEEPSGPPGSPAGPVGGDALRGPIRSL